MGSPTRSHRNVPPEGFRRLGRRWPLHWWFAQPINGKSRKTDSGSLRARFTDLGRGRSDVAFAYGGANSPVHELSGNRGYVVRCAGGQSFTGAYTRPLSDHDWTLFIGFYAIGNLGLSPIFGNRYGTVGGTSLNFLKFVGSGFEYYWNGVQSGLSSGVDFVQPTDGRWSGNNMQPGHWFRLVATQRQGTVSLYVRGVHLASKVTGFAAGSVGSIPLNIFGDGDETNNHISVSDCGYCPWAWSAAEAWQDFQSWEKGWPEFELGRKDRVTKMIASFYTPNTATAWQLRV